MNSRIRNAWIPAILLVLASGALAHGDVADANDIAPCAMHADAGTYTDGDYAQGDGTAPITASGMMNGAGGYGMMGMMGGHAGWQGGMGSFVSPWSSAWSALNAVLLTLLLAGLVTLVFMCIIKANRAKPRANRK